MSILQRNLVISVICKYYKKVKKLKELQKLNICDGKLIKDEMSIKKNQTGKGRVGNLEKFITKNLSTTWFSKTIFLGGWVGGFKSCLMIAQSNQKPYFIAYP